MPFALPIGNTFLGVDQGDKGEHDNDANNLENTSDDLPGLGLIELFLFLFFLFPCGYFIQQMSGDVDRRCAKLPLSL